MKESVAGPEAGEKEVAGKKGAEEVKSTESAVSREEKSDATAVSRWPFLVLTVTFICHKRSFPDRFAKISFGDFSVGGLPACQVYSRTRMRPSSKWISGACHVWLWSRADCFGGAGMRRIVDWRFEIGDLRLGEDSGGRMMRSGMSGGWPRVLLE